MDKTDFKQFDFENPSKLFVLEDVLKNLVGGALLYNRYYRTFGLSGSERVLDFGCGGGVGSRCLLKLLGKDGHVISVDLSGYWTKKAANRLKGYPNAEVRRGDIREMAIRKSSFDVITIFHVIHDIVPDIRQETAGRLSGLLKPEGRLFIKEPVRESHGMPAEEIRTLFTIAGLFEFHFAETGSEYSGEYRKMTEKRKVSR
jgi:SAM-dependent methyltransferase